MAIDRGATVKKAEDLVREGKPELAIGEYLRLVEDQPGDVGAANALGDLYLKIGNRAQAVAQFVQIGDSHRDSGFIPKAVAFYKKALKVDPASDHALSRLAQIAVDQELYADATLYLNRLLQRRREQGNEAGVAECLVRLGGFPSATADAKMAAARAAAGHFAASEASRLWVEAADALERAGRPREALDVLMQAASLDGDDVAVRRRVAIACADSGQIERARPFLSFEIAGDRGDLLLALAGHALAEGRGDDARHALQRVIEVAPERRAEAEALLAPLLPRAPLADDPGDVTNGAFESAGDAAAAAPEAWGTSAANEGEPEPVDEPGWDPLLEDGGGAELDTAPAISADFGAQAVAAVASGAAESPEGAITATELEWSALLGADGSGGDVTGVDTNGDDEFEVDDESVERASEVSELAPASAPASEPAPEPEPVASKQSEAPVEAPAAELRAEEATRPVPAQPTAADTSTIAALTAAAENPALQFQASAQLGRLLLRLDRGPEGVAWLERATQATTAVREQRLDVMYELADALEQIGEPGRALDVFSDLDFDAASYRDVPERLARLRRALEEGGAR